MIIIKSCLHRDDLCNIIRRWMYGDFHPSDAGLITRIVHYNNVYISRYLTFLADHVFKALHSGDVISRVTHLKRDLKDAIVSNPPYHNHRIDELIYGYQTDPGRYYRETPFYATLFFIRRNGVEEYLGSKRIKRVHRLAEKSARRIIDWTFDTIKKNADTLADDRARRLGIPREQLFTSQEEMFNEFVKAEERLIQDFRYGRQIQNEEDMIINDVAGMKVILEDSEHNRLFSILADMGDCDVVENEKHSGKYNATNILLRYSPPKETLLSKPLNVNTLRVLKAKGMSEEEANRGFVEFVMSGEDSVYLEIIVSNYEEMLESEIGRCMHEDRIIEQRLHQPYRGHLAKNIEYLMEYIFTFPISPQAEMTELPIKIWNRYLPDYFEDVLRKLFQMPYDAVTE
jgi:hypothetical protein